MPKSRGTAQRSRDEGYSTLQQPAVSLHPPASRHIQFQLYRDIEERGLGRVYDAPMDLQLSETDVVQPDLMVILAEHRHYVSPSRLLGPPDLVVEILSPGTAERDRPRRPAEGLVAAQAARFA